jgi:hypothetical protein
MSQGIQATWNLSEPPSESIFLITGGVVLQGNTYGEDSFRGKDVAIVIASLTQHYRLEPSCLNTHTHLSSKTIERYLSPSPATSKGHMKWPCKVCAARPPSKLGPPNQPSCALLRPRAFMGDSCLAASPTTRTTNSCLASSPMTRTVRTNLPSSRMSKMSQLPTFSVLEPLPTKIPA